MKITALWPDGYIESADSWRQLEEQLRQRQWTKMSVGQLRREIRHRVEAWSGIRVSIRDPEALFRGLESADMVRLEVTDDDEEPPP